ncbi:hypothetical protein JG687_00018608 [Phytophthora cactorum]|uniref:Ankyrin repeat-containing domain n=1 Tax=Phytophthora cactorum TaxID=29920 RepID=A0A8T1TMB2_9STRA|nr:hypothetical protein JG687_00018608 [Phytophthora cactorum]
MDSCSINRALTSAAGRGYKEIVEALLGKSDAIGDFVRAIIEVTALEGNSMLVNLLRPRYDSVGISNALTKARSVGCDEAVALLCSKKSQLE